MEPHPNDLFASSSPKRNVQLGGLDSELEDEERPSGSCVSESLLDSDNEDELPPHLASVAADLRVNLEKNRKPDLRSKLDSKSFASVAKEDLKMSSDSSAESGNSSDEDSRLTRVVQKCVAALSEDAQKGSPSSPKRESLACTPSARPVAAEVVPADKNASPVAGGWTVSAEKLEKLEKRLVGAEKRGTGEKRCSERTEKRRSGSKK
jgi:hypothetical protein